ncbi:hypothetical protein [Photobacterium leiognathi]|uniref:hypothetical protein n=1 Tax=Photobacterium leiognathi TaxID=553611 RepID=UPI00298203A4|nr:hypothetical protein [Photobacterium leiognathi]
MQKTEKFNFLFENNPLKLRKINTCTVKRKGIKCLIFKFPKAWSSKQVVFSPCDPYQSFERAYEIWFKNNSWQFNSNEKEELDKIARDLFINESNVKLLVDLHKTQHCHNCHFEYVRAITKENSARGISYCTKRNEVILSINENSKQHRVRYTTRDKNEVYKTIIIFFSISIVYYNAKNIDYEIIKIVINNTLFKIFGTEPIEKVDDKDISMIISKISYSWCEKNKLNENLNIIKKLLPMLLSQQ